MCIKISKKLGVREMMQAGSIVTHIVREARNKVVARDVSMMSLVQCLGSEEISRSARRSRRAFSLPEKRRRVVGARQYSTFADVKGLHGRFVMDEAAGEFEITVRDGARGVSPSNQIGHDVGFERSAPNKGAKCARVRRAWI
jgi:hypothetical protein